MHLVSRGAAKDYFNYCDNFKKPKVTSSDILVCPTNTAKPTHTLSFINHIKERKAASYYLLEAKTREISTFLLQNEANCSHERARESKFL